VEPAAELAPVWLLTMKLRAKQSCTINVRDPNTGKMGVRWIKGPEYDDNEHQVDEGEVIEVGDDFEVNPAVFEFVRELRAPEPSRGVPGVYEVIKDPRGVRGKQPQEQKTAG
jgi:hypothetical protein